MPRAGSKKPGSGGRPTPTAILERRGSWRAKTRPKEPQPELGIPPCPKILKGYAKRTWTEMCRELDAIGILTTVDGKALARYCRGWAVWCAMVEDETPDLDGKRFEAEMRLSERLLKFEIQFGLTPASRPSVVRLEKKPPHGNAKQDEKARLFKVATYLDDRA